MNTLLELALTQFAQPSGLELPIYRTLLGALKRQPKVVVTANRRETDGRGNYFGKTTTYDLTFTGAVR